MEHWALYRKWRPQNFHTVVGQEDTVKVLRNAVVKNRVAHAYLFCGTRGTGKTSTARILAKALNCTDLQNGEPCNHCPACTAITEGNFMDVVEIDAASNRGIEDARSLLEKVAFVPVQGKRKVYIIDECHMLTNEAFNTLLKTLEEPPDHVVFILATTEVRKVPMTILSRCQRFDFRTIGQEDLFRALRAIADAEAITAADDAIELLAECAKGSMRDALTLLDQLIGAGDVFTAEDINHLIGAVHYDFWPDFFRNLADNNLPAVFGAIDGLSAAGKDLRRFFRDFRDIVGDLISGASEHRQGTYAAMLKQCASPFSPQQILEILTICGESEIVFRYNQDGKAVCRFLMARIMKALHPTAVIPENIPAEPPDKPQPQIKEEPGRDIAFPAENVVAAPKKQSVSPKPKPEKELPPWEDAPEPPPEPELPPPDEIPDFSVTTPVKPKATPQPAEFPPWQDLPDFSARSSEKQQSTKKADTEEKIANLPTEPPAAVPPTENGEEELWAAILKQVRELNPSTHTWLIHGTPETVSEEEVVISYRENNLRHYNRIIEPSHRNIVTEALKKVFNKPVNFRAELQSPVEEPSLF